MAAIAGSVRVGGFVAPTDSTDTYAVTDDVYGRGGYRPVADSTARDAISTDRRKIGMLVRTTSDSKFWTLVGGIANGNWTEVQFGVQINDATGTSTTVTWSVDKIKGEISLAVSDLIDGAGATLDTLKELADALNNDPSFAANIATEIANRVRYDSAQTLTAPQQAQARSNIGAASESTLTTLVTNLGDIDHNFVTDYSAAKV